MSAPALSLLIEEAISKNISPVLFLKAEVHEGLGKISGLESYQPDFTKASQLEGRKIVNHIDLPKSSFPLIIYIGQKSRGENLTFFNYALSHLSEGGTFIVSMANDLGAGRYEKELGVLAGCAVETFSKSKCRVFSVTLPSPLPNSDSTSIQISSRFGPLLSVPGIFSEKEVDPGSELLSGCLRNLQGLGADLGCGYGFLSLAALSENRSIARIDLYESDYRALACARVNLKDYPQCNFSWSDVTKGIKHNTYDWIVSNPPFHVAAQQEISLGKRFIQEAIKGLKAGGHLYFVQNDHLAYKDTFEGVVAEERARKKGFIVWDLMKI